MPLQIIRQDITKLRCDAIVNAAGPTLLGDSGADRAIHVAAGPEMEAECLRLGGCRTGHAVITRGYRLPCRHVIHTVGPIWQGGDQGEADLLAACYRQSLELAEAHHCRSVAFPLISVGAFGYPMKQATQIATDTITAFLDGKDLTVYLVVYDRQGFRLMQERYGDIAEYIDQHYVDAHPNLRSSRRTIPERECPPMAQSTQAAPMAVPAASSVPRKLTQMLGELDESFSEMLLRKIDELGYTDSQCYKKANISRKHFSKIRSDRLYKPSKATALVFAIALELPFHEAEELLRKAGFAFSPASKSDVIVEYFIRQNIYDIYAINEALFAFGQSPLGV